MWVKYDTDQNGVLDKNEGFSFLKQYLTDMIGEAPSDEDVKRNFDIIDTNGNGNLEKKNLLVYLSGFKDGTSIADNQSYSPRLYSLETQPE